MGRWTWLPAIGRGSSRCTIPGAQRLLWSLGMGDTMGWLGDGSLSLQAGLEAAPDRVALSSIEISAGALRATGDLTATGLASDHRALTGKIDAETLPLPAIHPQSTDPWVLTLLRTTDAKVAVHAGQLLWGLAPVAEDAAADIGVTNGAIRIDGLTAHVAGGALNAQLGLDLATPPRVSVSGKATDLSPGWPAGRHAASISSVAIWTSAPISPARATAPLASWPPSTVRCT